MWRSQVQGASWKHATALFPCKWIRCCCGPITWVSFSVSDAANVALHELGFLPGDVLELLVDHWNPYALRFVGRLGEVYGSKCCQSSKRRVLNVLQSCMDTTSASSTEVYRRLPAFYCDAEQCDRSQDGRLEVPVFSGSVRNVIELMTDVATLSCHCFSGLLVHSQPSVRGFDAIRRNASGWPAGLRTERT
jgi:hypothetical protein